MNITKTMTILTRTSGKESFPGKVVCLIKYGKEWILGVNDRTKTSPKWRKQYAGLEANLDTRHAEEHAIQILRSRGDEAARLVKRVIVLRWTKDGRLGLARPCKECAEKLSTLGISPRKVHYSTEDGGMDVLAAY